MVVGICRQVFWLVFIAGTTSCVHTPLENVPLNSSYFDTSDSLDLHVKLTARPPLRDPGDPSEKPTLDVDTDRKSMPPVSVAAQNEGMTKLIEKLNESKRWKSVGKWTKDDQPPQSILHIEILQDQFWFKSNERKDDEGTKYLETSACRQVSYEVSGRDRLSAQFFAANGEIKECEEMDAGRPFANAVKSVLTLATGGVEFPDVPPFEEVMAEFASRLLASLPEKNVE